MARRWRQHGKIPGEDIRRWAKEIALEKALPPQIYAYQRVSDETSWESQLGLTDQEDVILYFIQGLLMRQPDLEWNPDRNWFREDGPVSAYRKPLAMRRAGGRLTRTVTRGDHIVFARLDRAFRSARDFHNLMARWEKQGVTPHFADINLDGSTAAGKFALGILANASELWSGIIGQNTAAALAQLRKHQRPWTAQLMGFDIVGNKGSKRLVANVEERRIMQEILRQRRLGHTYGEISDMVEEWLAKKECRQMLPRKERYWSPGKCYTACRAEQRLKHYGL